MEKQIETLKKKEMRSMLSQIFKILNRNYSSVPAAEASQRQVEEIGLQFKIVQTDQVEN